MARRFEDESDFVELDNHFGVGFGTDRVFDVGVGLAISGLQVASDFTVYDLLPVYETKSSPVFATPPTAVFELSDLLAANGGDGSLGFVVNGINEDDYSGRFISSAGDINGDGFEDIIIGVTRASPNGTRSGESYVIFGSDTTSNPVGASLELSDLNGSNGFAINGVDTSDYSGQSVSSAGDFNGDGFDDILIGAFGAGPNGNNSGEIYLVFGRDTNANPFNTSFELSSVDGNNGFVINGIDPYDGASVASNLGDINGDGFDDIIIGAPGADANGSNSGESYVIFGSSADFDDKLELSSLNGTNGFVLSGIGIGDRSGRVLSTAGDLNGDGFDDFLIGTEPSYDNANGTYSGESYFIFGRNTDVNPFDQSLDLSNLNGSDGFIINGVDSVDRSGYALSSAGDINGDGFDDLLIGSLGAFTYSSAYYSGESYVIFGRDTNTDPFGAAFELSSLDGNNGFIISGIDFNDFSGASVSSAGDVNGDGFDDILIGTFSAEPSGEGYVVFGRDTTVNPFGGIFELSSLNGTNGFIINGIDDSDNAARSVSAAGDINGDGLDDILIGAPRADPNDDDSGETYIIYGRADFGRTTEMLTPGDDVYVATAEQELVYGLAGNDTIIGAAGGDFLFGDAGDDVLSGADGNDVLEGGAGADALDGGTGIDTVSYELSAAGVSVFLSSGNASGGNAAGDSLSNIENAIGSANNDTLTGSTDDNHLIGRSGNDTLRGAGGDDVVEGGDGEDTILGNAGEDNLSGGVGNDLIIGGGDDDLIDGGLGDDQLSGQGGDDTIIGNAGIDDILGGAGADTIRAGTGDDIVNAGGGNDTVNGDDGADNLSAGAGSDTVYGGAGDDMVFGNNQNDMLFGDDGGDILDGGAGNDLLSGGDGDDALFGAGSQDTLLGGLGIDLLFGGSGGDNLDGGDGNDTLEGGGGNDTLTGGAGADTFSQTSGFRSDRITDFENGIDLIDFSNNISANSFADVMAAASQSGANVRIELNPNNILILENFDLADLDASDFIF